MKIAVIGLGFVGLTSALGFASKGIEVYGYDAHSAKAETIAGGVVPFLEPGLEEALRRSLGTSFYVAQSMREAVEYADAVFFCVGTPCNDEGEANLEYIKAAVSEAAQYAPKKCVFTIKSTVPPSTVEQIIAPMAGQRPVAMNPEFLREGHAWEDFIFPDRVVVGVGCDEAWKILSEIYECFGASIYRTTTSTAEFIKYLSNSLLATLISFSNEMAEFAHANGNINISDAFHILWEDKRLRGAGISHYIYPGCGYGGSCLPKDTNALYSAGQKLGQKMPILSSVITTNEDMAHKTASRIAKCQPDKHRTIGILGLAFNPNSDDVRSTPAAGIIQELYAMGYSDIVAYDPVANQNFSKSYDFSRLKYCVSVDELCRQCEVVAIVTVWDEFQGLNLKYPGITFVDCRYFLSEA